jgi:hypothetical protein
METVSAMWRSESPLDDDGAADSGAVWILLMNADGTVKGQTKLSASDGTLI